MIGKFVIISISEEEVEYKRRRVLKRREVNLRLSGRN